MFPCSLDGTTYYINKSTHGVSLLILLPYVSYDPIFRFFDLCNAHQRVNSVIRLRCFYSYSMYVGFNLFLDKIYLSYYFTNLSKVHPGPCTHAFFSHVNVLLVRLALFDLALSSTALLEVGQ